jgi:hypothetical protein
MVFREDEKRPESGVRPGQNLEQNRNSGTDQVHKNDRKPALQLLCQKPVHPLINNIVPSPQRRSPRPATRTYRAVSSDIEKLHVEPKDER